MRVAGWLLVACSVHHWILFLGPGETAVGLDAVAFLAAMSGAYLLAAAGVRRRARWGWWLGFAITGIECVVVVPFAYILAIMSFDPAQGWSAAQWVALGMVLVPAATIVALFGSYHRRA